MSSPGDTPGAPRRRLTLVEGSGVAARRAARRAVARRRRAGRPRPRSRRSPTAAGSAARRCAGSSASSSTRRRTADGTGFLPFDDVSEMLADRARPARAGRPAHRPSCAHRESPGVAGGYLANGCIECDALIGRFQLEDLLHEHLQAGGTYAQLDIGVPVELPAVALARRLTAHA